MRRGQVLLPELELLELIAKGIDPRTGAPFAQTPRHRPLMASRDRYLEDLRRLNRLLKLAEKGDPAAVWSTQNRQGRRWTPEEDAAARALWADPRQLTAQAVGRELGRSEAGTLGRLVTLGVAPDLVAIAAEDARRYALIPAAPAARPHKRARTAP